MLVWIVVAGIVLAIVVVVRRIRSASEPHQRRRWLALLVVIAVVVVGASALLAFAMIQEHKALDRPRPAFPSLATTPDPTLHGTIAYVSGLGDPTAREVCVRVVAASGGQPKNVLCRPSNDAPAVTAVWRPDRRLLVTSFELPVGTDQRIPTWAKIVDVTSGKTQDVPASELDPNAHPPIASPTNAAGERLTASGADGDAKITVSGPSGTRTILSVKHANLLWGLQTGPVWSPDARWILTWDGERLLLTTVNEPAKTRVLATDVSGGAFPYEIPNFAITSTDLARPNATTPTT